MQAHIDKVFDKKISAIMLVIIIVLAFFLRLPNFNESLWFDEVEYSTRLTLKNFPCAMRYIFLNREPPFYSVFMFFWISVFGDSEISVRIPALLLGLSSIMLIYFFSLRVSGRRVALLTALLTCLSPVHIWYSHEATLYTMNLFFLLLSILYFYKLKESQQKIGYFTGYFVALLLAAFTQWFSIVYLLLISLLCVYKIDKTKRTILVLNLLVLACVILYLLFKIKLTTIDTRSSFWRPFSLFELWMLLFNWFCLGNSLWSLSPYRMNLRMVLQNQGMFFSQIFFLFIFAQGIRSMFKESKKYAVDIVLYLFFLPSVLLGLSFFRIKDIYIERYLFLILPFVYIILSKGIFSLKNHSLRSMVLGIFILFNIASLIGFFAKDQTWTVYKHNPDWRSAGHYFAGELSAAKKKLFIFASTPADALKYYLLKNGCSLESQAKILYDYPGAKYEGISAEKIGEIYLVRNEYWRGDFQQLFDSTFRDQKFRFLSRRGFKGLTIYKFHILRDGAS